MEDDLLLSEEEARKVTEGEAAASLLDSPAFLLAIERIRADCAEHILTSDPAATQQREDLYNLSRGLSAVTSQLLDMSAEAQVIVQNAARPTQDEDVQAYEPDDDVQY